jgi:hypothetical protein
MFRIIHSANALPYSFPLDPSAQFEAGQVAQITVIGNNTVVTTSNGKAPLGIIDDYRTKAFTANIIDEEHIITFTKQQLQLINNVPVTLTDNTQTLDNAYILGNSFTARQVTATQVLAGIRLVLNANNGVVTIPAGTALNFSITGTTLDSIRFLCSYSYRIPNYAGEDTTRGSNRVTVWYHRMIIETSMFETNQSYPINEPLYVNERGYFTTRKIGEDYPAIGFVVSRPNKFGNLQLMWH